MKHAEFKRAAPAGPAGADFYALLGLEERFALDLEELERRYLERSREVHPDRFVNAGASQRVSALQQSMQLNDAYKTLKKPVPRAEYLLRRHGVTIGANEQLDPAFLMEVLELREELQEAKMAGQSDELRRLEQAMLARRDATLVRVSEQFAAFERSSDEDGRRTILDEIKKEIILLRYIQRYLEELEDDFDEGEV